MKLLFFNNFMLENIMKLIAEYNIASRLRLVNRYLLKIYKILSPHTYVYVNITQNTRMLQSIKNALFSQKQRILLYY